MNIAQTILQQLGGNRFIAMTGAKNLVAAERSLQFKIGRGAVNKATNVRVTLGTSDTYTVEFFAIRGVNVKTLSQHENIYADGLQATFTEQTGMATSL
jgi:hypothetical protein